MACRRQIDDLFLGDVREMTCLKLAKPLLATGVFWHKIIQKHMLYTSIPGFPKSPGCFEWKRSRFGGFKPQNKGQTASRYIYIYTYIRKSHILYRCVSLFHYQSKNQFLTFSFKGPPRTKCSFSTNITGVKEVGKPSGPNRPCQW